MTDSGRGEVRGWVGVTSYFSWRVDDKKKKGNRRLYYNEELKSELATIFFNLVYLSNDLWETFRMKAQLIAAANERGGIELSAWLFTG